MPDGSSAAFSWSSDLGSAASAMVNWPPLCGASAVAANAPDSKPRANRYRIDELIDGLIDEPRTETRREGTIRRPPVIRPGRTASTAQKGAASRRLGFLNLATDFR